MNRYKNCSKEILVERAKELECLYMIDEALTKDSLAEALLNVSQAIPLGFQNTQACTVTVFLDNQLYFTKPLIDSGDTLQSEITIDGETRGYIKVMYPYDLYHESETIFLEQEKKLLNTIANKLAENIYKRKLQSTHKRDWEAILDLLQKADEEMLLYVCEKMLSLLGQINPHLLKNVFHEMQWLQYETQGEVNFPLEKLPNVDVIKLRQILFMSANKQLTDKQIDDYINLWVYQGKTHQLIKIVDKKDLDVKEISKALTQYVKAIEKNQMSRESTKRWLKAELTRRFLSNDSKLISNIQKHVTIEAFIKLLDTFICSPRSMGRIGGKGTGLFIASEMIKAHHMETKDFANVKVPKTWYISSDELVYLIESNGLEELNEHKYEDMVDIRTNYPRIIHMLKNARLSSYVLNELYQVLEDCENKPLIVRSSSLLEDQIDSSFSGKYKSLFLTNTGTKAERKRQLVEAILEVYASMFNPDSIQYRKERNLLDCSEQMGIMIQEVVGSRVGSYFFPLYSGVAFSHNELRWSPRIKREDGLLRMVMGLGTRAVDRVGEDFPILISPGQPNLRVNQTPQELQKYSPQMIDAIDMENNRFVTLPINDLIKEYGNEIPYLNHIASVLRKDFLTTANKFTTDFKSDEVIITFDYLIKNTPMIKQIQSILELLKENLGYPVDVEFASDGQNFYLLQCRPQSTNRDNAPVAIPSNISLQDTLFTANKYISNGKITGIKTVVYVDPTAYGNLERHEDLVSVGTVIGKLNNRLFRRSFILMGPGRWGSRGDIKLGVPVTYSDINNASMLIEIAQEKSKYQPELSFGTHFFQDLVEENIKYLPLYPEDNDIMFRKSFFSGSKNALADILPEYAYLSEVIKVIQIEQNYFERELCVLMNADLEKAIAYLHYPKKSNQGISFNSMRTTLEKDEVDEKDEKGWKWRHYMAEQIAQNLDMKKFGIKGIYLFGSTSNCTARLNSDIDLLIHLESTKAQKEELSIWLNGWSIALSEMNFLKTGYRTEGLLDVHFVTDQDILDKNSYAIKIDSVYDPAFPLRIDKE